MNVAQILLVSVVLTLVLIVGGGFAVWLADEVLKVTGRR